MNRTRLRSRCWRAVAVGGTLAAFLACGPALPALAGSVPSAHSSATPSAARPSAAQAADPCNTPVVDTTPTHVLGNDSAVAKATEQLESKGADVRVRVLPTTPDGSLDGYKNAEVAACPSWSLSGQIAPNLLVFLVALDHNDAIYYGQDYGNRLQGKVDQIRTDMGSYFRAGNFAAGIARAEQETYTALYGPGSASSASSSDSIGLSGEIIGWVGLVLCAALVIMVVRLIWRRIRTGRWDSGRSGGWFSKFASSWRSGDGSTGFWDSGGGDSGGGDSGGGGDAGGSSGHW